MRADLLWGPFRGIFDLDRTNKNDSCLQGLHEAVEHMHAVYMEGYIRLTPGSTGFLYRGMGEGVEGRG